jgi:NADPH-dependent glutamate synthase beta subunit-like oxidoreductase/ferredoxin
VDAPGIADAILAGDHERACRMARGPNPFASSCGHGCHAPCEATCRRRNFGAPVAIAALEAYAARFSTPALLAAPEPCTSAHDVRSVAGLVGRGVDAASPGRRSGKRVAIVGGGVAGMACAHDLTLLGHQCVIIDAGAEPGGVLTGVVPPFRFPLASTRAECASILALGIEYHTGRRLAKRGILRALRRQGFDAVFVAIGASHPGGAIVEGEASHPSVVDAMDLLATNTLLPGRVVVTGQGDLAVDAARVLARRSRGHPDDPQTATHLVLAAPMEEALVSSAMLAAAVREGVALHHGWRPRRILFTPDGQTVTGIDVARADTDITKVIPCDRVVLAAPRIPAPDVFAGEIARTAAGFIAADPETMQTSLPFVWAGGACVSGHRSIAHATADGKRAAWQIHAALTGVRVSIELSSAWVEIDDRDPDRTRRALETPRAGATDIAAPPADPFAPVTAADTEEITRQAARCFDCTVTPSVDEACTGCGKCVGVCPTGALSLDRNAPHGVRLDQDACTRCGLCVHACPHDAIAMVRAVWEERLVSS